MEAVTAAASPVTSTWVKMFSTPRIPFWSAESISLVGKSKDDSKKGAFEEKVKFLEAASWDVLCNSTKQVLNFGHHTCCEALISLPLGQL